MDKVKVLHMITHLGVGGALDNTLLTVRGLSRDRYKVHLAAGELAPGEVYTDWKARGREYSDALFLFPDLRRPIHLGRDLRALKQITDFIREQNYDIVHTHCAKAGVLGRIAARRAGVPLVVHTCHAFGWQVARAYSSGWLKHTSSVKKWVYVILERYVASLSDMLITVAELNKHEALALNLAPKEKITTIYSGIDLSRFNINSDRNKSCSGLGLDPNRPVVGTIGRFSIQKAPLDFVKAAKLALRRKPDAQFIMVGDGPLISEVQKAIGEEQRIKIYGFLDNVPEILSILDVFVMSSLWEGLGRALTEAMIMSVPVAATAVDGVPELVDHEMTGLLSAPRDPGQLAENIVWLLNHPEQARKMSQSARARVVPAFSAERMVEQIDALYETLLDSIPASNGQSGSCNTIQHVLKRLSLWGT